MPKNAFGLELPEIKEIVTDPTVKATLGSLLVPVFTYLGVQAGTSKEIIADCLQAASNYAKLEDYEDQAHAILEKEQMAQKIPQKLQARANLIYSQIQQYLLPGNVLDYGCGDGQVAELIAKGRNQPVTLTDVYEHSHIKETGLNFHLFTQSQKTQFNNDQFDNTLALTVFHHSSNPLNSIQDVHRVTKRGGRVLVIESVYGVDGEELPQAQREKFACYLSLSWEQQRKVNVFFDHFYNRVLHYSKDAKTKVNVPFNFNTPSGWKKIFAECGLEQAAIVHLGLDQPTVPEYHTLHVLRKV
jgi:SAM-dependent methyltransferase